MKKTQFIIGLGQKASEYELLSKCLKIIQPDWNNSRVKINKCDTLIGFSLGCMLATMYAEKHNIKHLILCSPTPDETLKNVKAKKITFIVGDTEKWVIQNIYRVAKELKCSWFIFKVSNTGHKINKQYKKILLMNLDDQDTGYPHISVLFFFSDRVIINSNDVKIFLNAHHLRIITKQFWLIVT